MDPLALVPSDETVVFVVWKVLAHKDLVVIAYGEPTSVQGPVVPPAQTEAVPGIVPAV
jgi:hypothetical protein